MTRVIEVHLEKQPHSAAKNRGTTRRERAVDVIESGLGKRPHPLIQCLDKFSADKTAG